MVGTLKSRYKRSLINGLRVRVLRGVCQGWIEVIVLNNYRHYSRHDVLVVDCEWFYPDSH